MSIMKKVSDFARSPQGRKAMEQAKKYARDPKNKQKIDRVRDRLTGKGKSH